MGMGGGLVVGSIYVYIHIHVYCCLFMFMLLLAYVCRVYSLLLAAALLVPHPSFNSIFEIQLHLIV